MTYMLFLAQNWTGTKTINHLTGLIAGRVYKNLTNAQIDRLIKILYN